MTELRRCAGGQFDPNVVEAFVLELGLHLDVREAHPDLATPVLT